MSTHAEIARNLVDKLPPGVFAHAVQPAVTYADFTTLEVMLPGIRFEVRKVATEGWQLGGTCADGSTVIWRVGS